jgi:hypothetical protein
MVISFHPAKLTIRKPEGLNKQQYKHYQNLQESIKDLKTSCPGGYVPHKQAITIGIKAACVKQHLDIFRDSKNKLFVPPETPIYTLLDEVIAITADIHTKRRRFNPVGTIHHPTSIVDK